MIFKNITLKNFKSHIDTKIEFQKGTTLILGDNGAGKSSIFEGINFALYKKYNTKSLNDLINSKADNMMVSLSFIVGNREYKVERTRTRSKSTAKLFVLEDGTYNILVSGDKEVNNNIEELLGIDADLFLNAIYIKQGEIDSLITQKASERKKNIAKLLRLDDLEISYKNIANIISVYELKKNQTMALIEDDIKEDKITLINNQNILNERLNNKKQQLKLLENDIQNVKELIQEQNTLNLTYQKLDKQKTQLKMELLSLENDFQNIIEKNNNLKKYELIVQESSNLGTLLNYCQDFLNARQEYQQICQTERIMHQDIEKQLQPLLVINDIANIYHFDKVIFDTHINDNFKELENCIQTDFQQNVLALDNLLAQERELMTKIDSLKNIIAINKESLMDLKNIGDVCPTCQSHIDEERKNNLIINYQTIISENQEKLEKRTKELDILGKEKMSLEESKRDKQSFLDNFSLANLSLDLIKDKQKKMSDIKTQKLSLQQKMNKLQEQLQEETHSSFEIDDLYQDLLKKQTQYQEALEALNNMEDIREEYQRIENECADKNNELNNLEEKIKKLDFNANILQENQEKQNQLRGQYYPLVKEIGEIENNIKYNQMQIDEIEKKLIKNKDNKEQVKKLNEFINFLKNIRELYSKDGLQKDIRLSFKPRIERHTQSFFSKFDFDYSELRLLDDYDIVIAGPSGDSDISMISGGERIAIALSLRLGIAQTITANMIETILLDEPTIYLDKFRKQEFVNVIQSISLVPQMIIITHDLELESAADNVISVQKRDGQSLVA